MFDKVASDVFDQLIWPNWHKNINNGSCPRIWQRTFIKVAKESNIIPVDLASKLAGSPPLLALMIKSFDQQPEFPAARCFAVAIAYEMSQEHFHCDVRQLPELWRLRFFSSAIRAQWLDTIEGSFVLKKRFIQQYKSQPIDMLDINADCPPELDLLLCDSNALYTAYFRECYSSTRTATNTRSDTENYADVDCISSFQELEIKTSTSSISLDYLDYETPPIKTHHGIVHSRLNVA
ncbi:MAG: hypothetical protein HRU06_06370 [Oceanospirillaceae bacterium]|nr:hypothetical protein [Oceanospirillaceae bacterium]